MRDTKTTGDWTSLLIPSLALAVGGFVFGHTLGDSEVLLAGVSTSSDLDGDGLADAQEAILGTDFTQLDTDSDGFSDLEEFSRGSDPLSSDSIPPAADQSSIAATGRTKAGVFQAVTVIYVPDGNPAGSSLTFGALVGGELINIDPLVFFTGASLTGHLSQNGSGTIFVLETPIPEALLVALGNSGLFATYTSAGAASPTVVSTLILTSINAVLCQVVPTGTPTGGGGGTGPGSMYRPLSDGPDIPATWSPAMICIQDLHTVGVVGGVLKQQIDSSVCNPIGSDSYCPPDCENLAGTIIDMIDPLALIGG